MTRLSGVRQKEIERLMREVTRLEGELARAKLSTRKFLERTSAEVVLRERQKLETLTKHLKDYL